VQELLTIDQPEQLKALGHPLRIRVLETLGDEELTNRELAQRLGVDPGHLHFHVRMLLRAGLIELANSARRREKPYRAVARTIRVAPELISAGLTSDVHAAMLEEVQRAWVKHGPAGTFRSAQLTVRADPEQVRELMRDLAAKVGGLEEPEHDQLVVSLFVHPPAQGD
jgi:DNA-binding transcriptional ArsR family regulator